MLTSDNKTKLVIQTNTTMKRHNSNNKRNSATPTPHTTKSPPTPPSSPPPRSAEQLTNNISHRSTNHYNKHYHHNNNNRSTATFEYNNRILTAKRNGNLRVVMTEFISMKKNNIPMTQHTYNLVLESHAILRREGTPLTTILKSKLFFSHYQTM